MTPNGDGRLEWERARGGPAAAEAATQPQPPAAPAGTAARSRDAFHQARPASASTQAFTAKLQWRCTHGILKIRSTIQYIANQVRSRARAVQLCRLLFCARVCNSTLARQSRLLSHSSSTSFVDCFICLALTTERATCYTDAIRVVDMRCSLVHGRARFFLRRS